jgi:transposase InsO family protein
LVEEIGESGTSLRKTLGLVGVSRSTWHYRQRPRGRVGEPLRQVDRAYANRISPDERDRILALLQPGLAAGRSVYALWFDALDAGGPIASMKTWYRLAAAHLESERPARPRRRRPTTAMPQFEAIRPNQVWCWDISKLPGKYRGQWLNLYVVIDAFSRLIVGWRVERREDDELARDMFKIAITTQGVCPQIVHSDGGPSMMSDTLAELYRDLGITRSRNRPRVSNDNPYAESWFKTAKYQPAYPGWFGDLDHARTWAGDVIDAYNTRHHHTALEGHTPQSIHDGSWSEIQRRRQSTIDDLAAKHPERYRRPPRLKSPYASARLNMQKSEQRLQTG